MVKAPRPRREHSAVRSKQPLSDGRVERARDASANDTGRPKLAAVCAVALLLVLISSDFYGGRFWIAHPLTTAILASLVAVLVSVTVIEHVLNGRSERRWRLLAQYAPLSLPEPPPVAGGNPTSSIVAGTNPN